MKVILDANILIADFTLSSSAFKLLFSNANARNFTLYIPQIVLDEVINKFKSRLEKSIRDINSEIIKLNRLAGVELGRNISSDFSIGAVEKYKCFLDEIIDLNNIQIISYPETSHKYLVEKAIQIKKPFNANEGGYRDCLIWENVKSMVPRKSDNLTSVEIVFITANCTDFLTDERDFHPDLVSELKEEGLVTDFVFAFRSLNEFNLMLSEIG